MTEAKVDYKHMDELVYGFTLPNPNSKIMRRCSFGNATSKMKVGNIVLRWEVPSHTPMETEDSVSDSNNNTGTFISPCFPAGKDVVHSKWRVHVLTNHNQNNDKMLSVFLEFFAKVEKGAETDWSAIYIVRLLDSSGQMLVSRRSGIRFFKFERLSFGWKSFVSLESVRNLLESGNLRIEVDLTILQFWNYVDNTPKENSSDVSKEETTSLQPSSTTAEADSTTNVDESGTSTGEACQESQNENKEIEWITITCNGLLIPDGNKEKLIEKSGYFKKKFEYSPDLKQIGLGGHDTSMMGDIIHFLNGNPKDCYSLCCNNFERRMELFYKSFAFEIPDLMIACFNAILEDHYFLTVDQAVVMVVLARNYFLHDDVRCQNAMANLRECLMRRINFLNTSPIMKQNGEHTAWIIDCLYEAD